MDMLLSMEMGLAKSCKGMGLRPIRGRIVPDLSQLFCVLRACRMAIFVLRLTFNCCVSSISRSISGVVLRVINCDLGLQCPCGSSTRAFGILHRFSSFKSSSSFDNRICALINQIKTHVHCVTLSPDSARSPARARILLFNWRIGRCRIDTAAGAQQHL